MNVKEKKQILNNLSKYLYNNPNLKISKKCDLDGPFNDIETDNFYESLDKENNSYNNKLFNAYNISSMILYLTVCSIIKYWFDYLSELKDIKNN